MPLPIISVSQMRDWEDRTVRSGVPEQSVMQLAGQCLSEYILQLTKSGQLVFFLAGKGNNGGDARIAANQIPDRKVSLLSVEDAGDCLDGLIRCLADKPALIVDGLFGIGLNRSLDDKWVEFISKINLSSAKVLAVDCPSGLNCDTGLIMGGAVRADVTLTFGAPKIGLIRDTAADYVGSIFVAPEIGLLDELPKSESYWLTDADMKCVLSPRPADSHKGSYGHVSLIAGSTGYHGAALLSARSSLMARPGLVSIFTHSYLPVACQIQSAMVHPLGKDCVEALSKSTAILIGPGLAGKDIPDSTRQLTRNLWRESANPIIVDASALDWICDINPEGTAPRVITPHPGEAARMLDCKVSYIQENRNESAKNLARNYGATVVLKGRHSVIAQEEGPVLINSTGNSGLAQGGSGDILSGYIAGMLAQPNYRENVVEAIAYSVWKHGRSAERLALRGQSWGMEQLIDEIGCMDFD
mgnify:CR=1 FL=1